MMRRRAIARLIVTALAAGALAGSATSQDRGAARDEGRRLAADLAGQAQGAATTQPDAALLPHFSANPPNTDLAGNPDAIEGRASNAAQHHEGYQTVRSSIVQRPVIAAADVEATVARGKTIAQDADAFVGDVGGTSGSCRPLPPADGAGIPYQATCNVGTAIEQGPARCDIPLEVSVERRTTYRYWCEADGEACTMFNAYGCTRTGSHPGRCLQGYERNGVFYCTEPGSPINELSCTSEVPGAELQGTEVEQVVSDHWNESACAASAGEEGCAMTSERCTSGSETRTIDGVSVTRDCWAKERVFECTTTRAAQDCDALDADPSCRFDREECLSEDSPCVTMERIYRCVAPPTGPSAPQYICDGDIYCIGDACETIDRQPNTEFKDAAVALHAATDAQNDFNPETLRLFTGTRETCHSAVFGILNCCAGKAFPLIPYGQLLVALGCDREEILLHERDAKGLCAYVGSYCSSSILGICTSKRKAYCCFESKLSRILQEQGRGQIGKPWSSPRSETCQGFTAEEFARLDLSRMDFSEVYAEFEAAAKLPDELATSAALQQRITDYYQQAGGQ